MVSSSAAVHPFWHSPPRLAGTSVRGVTRIGLPATTMPHCRAQYGQWVGTSPTAGAPRLSAPTCSLTAMAQIVCKGRFAGGSRLCPRC
jgi:hypothetical protein